MNHGRECGQSVMIDEEGRAWERREWTDSLTSFCEVELNNVKPTTETDLQPSSVKRLSSHQMLVQFRSLDKSPLD